MKVYTDTSVFGGCFDSEFKFWSEKYFGEVDLGLKTICISRLVTQEILRAKQEVKDLYYRYEPISEKITVDDEVVNLAEKYIAEKVLSQKFFSDAVHIAASTVYKVDVIVSWNFKHIVNLIGLNYSTVST